VNRIFTLIILGLGIVLTDASCQNNTANAKDKNQFPFDVQLQLEKLENNNYNLLVTIDMEKGSYIISPSSPDSFYMHFDIFFEKNKNFIVDKELLEIPKSLPEIDPVLNTPVHFVREKTVYKKKFELMTKSDFEEKGMVEFLLEPSCIPYNIEFVLANNSGAFIIKNIHEKIHPYYRGK